MCSFRCLVIILLTRMTLKKASQVALVVKNLPANAVYPWAGESHGRGEHRGLRSIESQRVGYDWSDLAHRPSKRGKKPSGAWNKSRKSGVVCAEAWSYVKMAWGFWILWESFCCCFRPRCMAFRMAVPGPGEGPVPPAVEALSQHHGTPREVLSGSWIWLSFLWTQPVMLCSFLRASYLKIVVFCVVFNF